MGRYGSLRYPDQARVVFLNEFSMSLCLSVSLSLSISILILINFRRIPTGASLLNYSQSLPEVIVLKGRRSVFFLPGSDLVLNLDQKYDMIYIYI